MGNMRKQDHREQAIAVLAADAARRAALVGGEFEPLEALLAPDLIYIHSNGLVEDRETYIRQISQGIYRYAAMEAAEQDVETIGDLALLQGRVLITPKTLDGVIRPLLNCRSIMIWRENDGRWQLKFYQGTLIA